MKVVYLFNPGLIMIYIKQHNLTKKEFCKQCKVSITQLNKMYDCDATVGVKEWLRVANFINAHPLDLIKQIQL